MQTRIRSKLKKIKTRVDPTLNEVSFSLSKLKTNPLSLVGISIIVFFGLIAIFAPLLAPPSENSRDPYMIPRDGYHPIPRPPNEIHPFGTTQGQYDIFYGCIWGTRIAFYVGLVVVGSWVLIGVLIGSIAGYYGGVVDESLMRFTDIIIAFPSLILAMALIMAFESSLNNIIKALILVGWPTYARVIRGEVLSIKQYDYIEAAKAAGCSDFRVIVKHLLPNSIYPLLIMATLDVGAILLIEASLSFLGLGPPTGFTDLGQMIAFSRNWIVGPQTDPYRYWYTYTIPGLFIFMFVLGWNLFGDAFRDVFDPTLRRR